MRDSAPHASTSGRQPFSLLNQRPPASLALQSWKAALSQEGAPSWSSPILSHLLCSEQHLRPCLPRIKRRVTLEWRPCDSDAAREPECGHQTCSWQAPHPPSSSLQSHRRQPLRPTTPSSSNADTRHPEPRLSLGPGTPFMAPRRHSTFYRWKVCGPCVSKSSSAVFPTALGHFMSLCHFLVMQYFRLFHYYYTCHGDARQGPLMSLL